MTTLKDLAKELEVSVSTVSKALSDSHEISTTTKQKIVELAKKRHYTPNNIAVNLRKRETKTIGVIIPNIFNHFYTKILSGIETKARENGYKTIVSISNESLIPEQEGIDFFTRGSVDGVLLAPSEETEKLNDIEHILKLKEKGIPFVLFDRYIKDLDVDKVIVNDYKSSKDTIEYFKEKEKKNILVVSLLKNLNIGNIRKNGATESFKNILVLESDNEKKFETELNQYLNDFKVDAIFALDELSGIIALNLIRQKNLKIPDEISIISFSQGILSEYSYPKLSTINQHAKEIGSNAVELLLKRLKNRNSSLETKIITTTLDLNQTT